MTTRWSQNIPLALASSVVLSSPHWMGLQHRHLSHSTISKQVLLSQGQGKKGGGWRVEGGGVSLNLHSVSEGSLGALLSQASAAGQGTLFRFHRKALCWP